MKRKLIYGSQEYWNERYNNFQEKEFKHASGNGKLPFRRNFKAKELNTLIQKYNIKSVMDFGCGDGEILSKLEVTAYYGIEINENLVETLRMRFPQKEKYYFSTNHANDWPTSIDAAVSVDVIFHLLEDNLFEKYMEDLFKPAPKYVIIKSSNRDELGVGRNAHIKHRKFVAYISTKFPEYELIHQTEPRRKRFHLSISDLDSFFVFHKSSK